MCLTYPENSNPVEKLSSKKLFFGAKQGGDDQCLNTWVFGEVLDLRFLVRITHSMLPSVPAQGRKLSYFNSIYKSP